MNNEEKLKLIRCSQKRRIPVLFQMLEDNRLSNDEMRLLIRHYQSSMHSEFEDVEGARKYINERIERILAKLPANDKGLLPIVDVDLNETEWHE